MRVDKKEALALRRVGKSYNAIKKSLGIPKSTLSDWLRDSDWSNKIKYHLSAEAKKQNTIHLKQLNKIYRRDLEKIYDEARIEAKKEFESLKFHPLFIAGISIYWGEGDKSTKYGVKIANVDPLMIRLFTKFLCEICGVPKERIRVNILLYPDLNENECVSFWIKETRLSKENFTKSVTIQGRHKTRRVPYGVCNVNVSSTYLKKKMLIWLTLLPEEFIKNKYYRKDYYTAGVV